MSFVEQLKSSSDIVRVISDEMHLKRVGTTPRYVGKCPFHNEKTPSFSVHREKQFYYCFGCHEKGDVISFVMKFHGVTFLEARNMLAERAGLAIPQRAERFEPEAELRDVLYRIHEVAAKAFRENLFSQGASEARSYLAQRGLRQSMVEEFGLGLSDRSGSDLARRLRQFKSEHAEASGLVGKRPDGTFYDRFRGRLMFPIHNEQGKLIAFGGRAMAAGEEPKYLNSPETHIYKKSAVLYNMNRARQAIRKLDRVVLVEGYMDVIGVYTAGVEHVVASCGTALTAHQVRVMKRHTEHVTINFDPDHAGMNATERSLQILLDEGMKVRILELEGGLDPDEYVKAHGADRYRQRLEGARAYFMWLADHARRHNDMRTSEGRMAAFRSLLPAIRGLSDRIEQAAVASEVAEYLGIDRTIVLEEFRRALTGKQPPVLKPAEPQIPRLEREILHCLISGRETRDVLVPRLAECNWRAFHTAPIMEIILTLHQAEPDFAFPALEGRLNESSRGVLNRLMFSADLDDVRAEDLVRRLGVQLQVRKRESYAESLRAQIKQAERDNNFEEAMRLMKEYEGLKSRGTEVSDAN